MIRLLKPHVNVLRQWTVRVLQVQWFSESKDLRTWWAADLCGPLFNISKKNRDNVDLKSFKKLQIVSTRVCLLKDLTTKGTAFSGHSETTLYLQQHLRDGPCRVLDETVIFCSSTGCCGRNSASISLTEKITKVGFYSAELSWEPTAQIDPCRCSLLLSQLLPAGTWLLFPQLVKLHVRSVQLVFKARCLYLRYFKVRGIPELYYKFI